MKKILTVLVLMMLAVGCFAHEMTKVPLTDIHFEGEEFLIPVKDGERFYFEEVFRAQQDFVVLGAHGDQYSCTEEELPVLAPDLVQYYKMFKDLKAKKNEVGIIQGESVYVGHYYEYEPDSYASVFKTKYIVVAKKGDTVFFEEGYFSLPVQEENGKLIPFKKH